MNSNAGWMSMRVAPSGDDARTRCLAVLFEVGAQGVHEDKATLVTHFPPGTELGAIQRALAVADADVAVELMPVPDVDWSEAWKDGIGAQELGALSIVPPWLFEGRDAARTIVIEPGMAFGTGDHATTRGVIRLLPGVLRSGDVVADLGAGSAVLAIAAAKLGASQVYAIELDGESIPDAIANVGRNGVADRVHVFEGDAGVLLPLVAPVQLVLANIISSVLIELLPTIEHAVGRNGAAILSGILREERDAMLDELAMRGWRVINEDHEDIWWSASIARA